MAYGGMVSASRSLQHGLIQLYAYLTRSQQPRYHYLGMIVLCRPFMGWWKWHMEEWWRNGISQSQAAAWFDAVVVRVNAAKHGKAYSQAWQGNGICQSQAAGGT